MRLAVSRPLKRRDLSRRLGAESHLGWPPHGDAGRFSRTRYVEKDYLLHQSLLGGAPTHL